MIITVSISPSNIFNKYKWITVNDAIKYYGEGGIYCEVFEYTNSYTLLFKLPGVHKQDLILEKNKEINLISTNY